MSGKLQEAALGAATVALLLYAAVTAAGNMTMAVQQPDQARAACTAAAPTCGQNTLQLARNRDP